MATTTTINIELGTTFWLLIATLIGGFVLWSVMGSEGINRVLSSGVKDAFGN